MAKEGYLLDGDGVKYYPLPSWPIGSIFISVTNTNPRAYFGGTWVSFGTGRCLVGVDISQSEFNTVEKTGGEKEHTLIANELPAMKPCLRVTNSNSADGSTTYLNLGGSISPSITTPTTGRLGNTKDAFDALGNDDPHNNLQPYITVYMWKRTA